MQTYKTMTDELNLVRTKQNFPKAKIGGSHDAAEYARQFYSDDITIYESFFLILLNNANNTIGYVKISQGGITGTVVDPRIIAKYAIETLSTSIIMCHNHPSGTLKPSRADIAITEKVKNGLKLFDIKVLDHLILTENNYHSMSDNNEI